MLIRLVDNRPSTGIVSRHGTKVQDATCLAPPTVRRLAS